MGMNSHELQVGFIPEVKRDFPGEGGVGQFSSQPFSRELKELTGTCRHFLLSTALAKRLGPLL